MTEIDRIFEESRRRMDANIDRLGAEFIAETKRSMDRAFNRLVAICIGIIAVCALVSWLVDK